MRARAFALICAVFAACQGGIVRAGDPSPAESVHEPEKKMKMDEPMETGMMKEGMTKGDVKKAAERKKRELQPMMEQEERKMPADTGKP